MCIRDRLNVLDKVSSKTVTIKINIKQEFIFQNLLINVLKCENSEFDDDPEVTAYMQVIDLKDEKKDKVYLFNDWTFASSPSIRPFDHPVYDIWLKKCYSSIIFSLSNQLTLKSELINFS